MNPKHTMQTITSSLPINAIKEKQPGKQVSKLASEIAEGDDSNNFTTTKSICLTEGGNM